MFILIATLALLSTRMRRPRRSMHHLGISVAVRIVHNQFLLRKLNNLKQRSYATFLETIKLKRSGFRRKALLLCSYR